MPITERPRSMLASVVGWVLVVVVVVVALRTVVGTIMWVLRSVLVIAAIAGLVALYLWLKAPREDEPRR